MLTTTTSISQQSFGPDSITQVPTTCNDTPSSDTEPVADSAPAVLPPDAREQLFNEGQIGPIDQIQVSTERIVQLNGILFDLDPQYLQGGLLLPALSHDPEQFYKQSVQRWLANHPVLQHMEVRMSGTGLHGILWLDPPIDFEDEAERKRWCSIVKVVQATLPTDPNAPGITATTRALGSTNSKNNSKVRLLRKGDPVSPTDVIRLQEQMCGAPFKTFFEILTGRDHMSPCPICKQDDTTLAALDFVGQCYACGKVTIDRLCSDLFRPQKSKGA